MHLVLTQQSCLQYTVVHTHADRHPPTRAMFADFAATYPSDATGGQHHTRRLSERQHGEGGGTHPLCPFQERDQVTQRVF